MPGPISALSLVGKKENNINKIKAVTWAVTHSWNDECSSLLSTGEATNLYQPLAAARVVSLE